MTSSPVPDCSLCGGKGFHLKNVVTLTGDITGEEVRIECPCVWNFEQPLDAYVTEDQAAEFFEGTRVIDQRRKLQVRTLSGEYHREEGRN